MKKIDYFYFRNSDLLINVRREKNVVTYCSHRKMGLDEMIGVEHYIKTVGMKGLSLKIEYNGITDELGIEHKNFTENKLPSLNLPPVPDFSGDLDKMGFITRDTQNLGNLYNDYQDQDAGIKALKNKADEGFCFDRIGDILRDRNENHPDELKYRMKELVECLKEYNALSNKDIKINTLINI